MVCTPAAVKEVVVKEADPPFNAAEPSAVEPEAKLTLPVGVGPALVT
jgi:hypothetical protein